MPFSQALRKFQTLSVTDHLILPVKHLMQKPVNKRVSPALILMHSVMCEISSWQGLWGNRALLPAFLALAASFLHFLILYGPRNTKKWLNSFIWPKKPQKSLYLLQQEIKGSYFFFKHRLKDPLARTVTLHTRQPSPVRRNITLLYIISTAPSLVTPPWPAG